MNSEKFRIIELKIEGAELNYSLVKKLAETVVENELNEAMLIAWYDGKNDEEHPNVPECQHKPGWIAYAEGHGGLVQVNINNHEYSFIFTGTD